MKHAIVAWTPLHIINSLNIWKNCLSGEELTLFIYNEFANADLLTDISRKLGQGLEVIKINHQNLGGKLAKISRLYWNKNLIPLDDFDHIYLPGDNYFGRLLYSSLAAKGHDFHLHYYEDGMGIYLGAKPIEIKNANDALQKKLNKHSIFHGQWENCYAYQPNLVQWHDFSGELIKIPVLDQKNPAFPLIKAIFSQAYDEEMSQVTEGSVIYFDQPFKKDGAQIDELTLFNHLKAICDSLNIRIYVKLHPRSEANKYGRVNYLQTTMPWEIFLLFVDHSHLTLAAVNSTAVFSPYLLYQQRMPIIMLAGLVDHAIGKRVDEQTKKILANSLSMAKNFKGIYGPLLQVPENSKQLEDLLYEIKIKGDQ
ncbi:alpha-2,8-polysialyltransferase family protein [Aerococcus sp. JJEM-2022b]|uniref:polysialyltransferase family glycosyltransferase n=1 Tax=Aerococcus mictus TaxID=2976810 RepID=UPI00227A1625|nr:polysialyltransferase family glycosyltransferase [Aerococcus mictus]MCY3063017.1 alpha-2,8-polysialyltransferase family protein [Aerococcus mictus]